ncbi:MAG: hypothetical protein OXG69_09240 [bacterium]|nr:hypothetical protein [bacterium]
MSAGITERALDAGFESGLAERLRDLASTGASAEWLTRFLEEAASREIRPWQVGEAIAEAVLESSHGVVLPWNPRRDERNPRASLQGADLVGISNEARGHRLVFGEVKSSSDANAPPSVLAGRTGMVQQLEQLIDDEMLRFTLIKWLSARVDEGVSGDMFDKALAAFVSTCGAAVRFVGMLVRDTPADERDVSGRGRQLGARVSEPGSVELHVLYMPRSMARWIDWVAA